MQMNKQVRLRTRPPGIPQAEHFEIVEAPAPEVGEGEILVRNLYLSVEPAMRGWVSAIANYSEPVAIGAVMRSMATGRVVASRDAGYQVGDLVTGWLGWQEYACVRPAAIQRKLQPFGLPISTSLGVLGLNGLTAYFGLLEIGRPKSGQTVVVSTAAGSVGSCVGQIAKIKGCRTVGIAGGPNKTALCIDGFGYDVAIDYKADDLDQALSAACPEGVDIYFDNTAGSISDAVLKHLAVGARVVVCGTASVASWSPAPQGPRVERHLLVKRASMQGLLVMDHEAQYPGALEELSRWVSDGRLRYSKSHAPVCRRSGSVGAAQTGTSAAPGGEPRCMSAILLTLVPPGPNVSVGGGSAVRVIELLTYRPHWMSARPQVRERLRWRTVALERRQPYEGCTLKPVFDTTSTSQPVSVIAQARLAAQRSPSPGARRANKRKPQVLAG